MFFPHTRNMFAKVNVFSFKNEKAPAAKGSRGVCVVFGRCLRGVCVVFARCLRGVCVVFAWCLRGVCVVFAWCLYKPLTTWSLVLDTDAFINSTLLPLQLTVGLIRDTVISTNYFRRLGVKLV